MPDARPLRIGTRGSDLALWQAHHVRDGLRAAHPDLAVEIGIIKTTGDQVQDRPLHAIGGQGLFVKAIEERLASGDVDLAVHSMKDLPAVMPDGLVLAATPAREDPRDALAGAPIGARLAELPAGAKVGTGSLRRGALVRRVNPGVEVVGIRGNVPTRLALAQDGDLDAVILAAAGLRRLGSVEAIAELLDPEVFCPAPCQGLLALQCRADDDRIRELVAPLSDPKAEASAAAERAFLVGLAGGCTTPMACHAVLRGDGELHVRGLVVDPSGEPVFEARAHGPRDQAAELGAQVAAQVLAQGGAAVVAVHRAAPATAPKVP